MSKSKILIVDDEIDITTSVAFILKSRGYDVITAFDGAEGLATAKSESPDLILLDIMMPMMDGYEVCIQLKTDKKTIKIPIIIFSAKGELEAVSLAQKMGANDYIVKPFSLLTLLTKVSKFLNNRNI
jgi:two-component system alkaline phosphatase synthesis response regulator PhoP